MPQAPTYRNRTADEIAHQKLFFDSAGYFYRSMSWLDSFSHNHQFTNLLYACIEARMGIEYTFFEEVILSTGANLSRADYQRCLGSPRKLRKLLRNITPDYEKLQKFTQAVSDITPGTPRIIFWDLKQLELAWGMLSEYLHWFGARTETTDDPQWLDQAHQKILAIVEPIWNKLLSGYNAIAHPDGMKPNTREIWEDFRLGKIDIESARTRLNIIRPMIIGKIQKSG